MDGGQGGVGAKLENTGGELVDYGRLEGDLPPSPWGAKMEASDWVVVMVEEDKD